MSTCLTKRIFVTEFTSYIDNTMLVLMNETGSTLQRIANNTHVSLATSVHLERSFLQVSLSKYDHRIYSLTRITT